MKKLSYLIVLTLILALVLTGCSLLSNIGQAPATEQNGITYLTKALPPPNDLVGLWHFDETSGITAADSSVNGNHGTLVNMDIPNCWVNGQSSGFGKALSFDGSNDYVKVVNPTNLDVTTDYTLELWINANDFANTYPTLLNRKVQSATGSYYWIWIKSGYIVLTYTDGTVNRSAVWGTSFSTETWYHIALTKSGSSFTMYKNGESLGTKVLTCVDTVGGDLFIGTYQGSTVAHYNFHGIIDEVRIWNVALLPDQLGFYGFGGFLPPVSLGKPFKLGSTIPVKFQLMDAQGAFITDALPLISLELISVDPITGEVIPGDSSGAANTNNIFRYDPDSNQYIFNLSTKDLTAPATYRITVDLGDGTTREVNIGLK